MKRKRTTKKELQILVCNYRSHRRFLDAIDEFIRLNPNLNKRKVIDLALTQLLNL